MALLSQIIKPIRTLSLLVGASMFVSGCVTVIGLPQLCQDPKYAERDPRCPPIATKKVVVKKAGNPDY